MLEQGIEKFEVPMNELLEQVEGKRAAAVGGPRMSAAVRFELGTLEAAVAGAARAAAEARIAERIWAGDDTVFGPAGQPEVANRLGWLRVAQRTGELLPELDALAASSAARGDRVVLVLGMGGSSLAPEVLASAFAHAGSGPELRVLDSTVPSAVLETLHGLDAATTLVIAASKSGGTVETRSQLELFWEHFDHDPQAFAVITDPGSDLERLARERGFRQVVIADPEVGGRYSALTAFGITPATVAGFPTRELLAAGDEASATTHALDAADNPALHLGLLLGEAAKAGRDKLTIIADPSLGAWSSGSSSWSPSRPASTARASFPSPASTLARARGSATTASCCGCATRPLRQPRSTTSPPRSSLAARRRPRSRSTARPDSARSSS